MKLKGLIKYPKKLKKYFTDLRHNFSLKFLLFETCVFCFLYGFLSKSISLVLYPYMKNELNFSDIQMQYSFIVIWSPWNFNCWGAILSDLYPLLGYHKRWYIFIVSVLGGVSLLIVSFMPVRIFQAQINLFPVLMFFVISEVAFSTMLTEMAFVDAVCEKEKYKRHMTTWVVINRLIGSLCGNYVGVFISKNNPVGIFRIGILPAFIILLPLVFGFLPETKSDNVRFNTAKFKLNKKNYILPIIIGFAALAMNAIAFAKNTYATLAFVITMPIFIFVIFFIISEPKKAKMCLYIFLHNGLLIAFKSSRDGFFIASPDCLPQGPNFSYSFYYTYSQFAGNLSAILGAVIFQKCFKYLTVDRVFAFSTLLRLAAFVPELLSIYRVGTGSAKNVDEFYYVLGGEILIGMGYSLGSIGIFLLISLQKNDPMACTLFFGVNSLGYAFSKSVGAVMIDLFSVDFKSRPCSYDKYWLMSLLGRFLFPALTLCVVFLLIPDLYVRRDDEHELEKTQK